MPVSLTIHDVPDDVREELAARAARAGPSLPEDVRGQLIVLTRTPTADQVWDRVERRVRATGTRLSAETIVGLRDSG